ncbi:MAG: TatD family hydrolase [Caldilinea sp.]|uniref:TatD family hydrolase n=1 Tax=Caldilinea sp. TaxID=2293560 RepID=UPI002BC36C4E|nr:TatD family hydrolase [Caldilinea sp.]HRA67336.1 TatD family hydrolase [Caldilinea sp.]
MFRVSPVTLVDSHCHLDLDQFDADRDEVMAQARAAGVGLIVNPGIDLPHCRRAIELADANEELYVAVGIHPNSADQFDDHTLADLRHLAAHPKVVAIGEIGLDFYWNKVAATVQQDAFVRQLDLAAELGLPVIIHSRDANDAVADVLRTWVHSAAFQHSRLAQRPYAGVLHAYSGGLALAEEAYDWNFVLSLGGPVTFRNAHALHALLPALRLDRLMLETDAPYLTPHPYRGQRNTPGYVALVCEQIAKLRGLTAAQVAAQTSVTALRFYGLEDRFGVDFSTHHAAVFP